MRAEGWKNRWMDGRGWEWVAFWGVFGKPVVQAGSVKVNRLMECCVRAGASRCTLPVIVVVVVKEL